MGKGFEQSLQKKISEVTNRHIKRCDRPLEKYK